MKPVSITVIDVPETLGAELRALFDQVARSPRQRLGGPRDRRGRPMLVLHDWRGVGARYLRRYARKINPGIWIYRGGRHLAIHVSPPERRDEHDRPIRSALTTRLDAMGDFCLGRIIET